MLSSMRENLKALSWLLWLTVASFIIAIFVDWGRAGDAARADATWMAKVNGEAISFDEFRSAYVNLDRFYRQIYQDGYDAQALGVARQALDQLVRERLVLDEARRVGLRVAPEEVSRQITENPAFHLEGRFIGVDAYRNFLRDRGIDVVQYEADIAAGLLADKYRRLVTDGVGVTRDEVLEDYRSRNETVTADYVLLAQEDFPTPDAPSAGELEEYFRENAGSYWTPELRRAAFVLINPEALVVAPVSEEQARAYYDENQDRLYATPAQVRASHILFKVAGDADPSADEAARATAEGILARVRAGEDFAELARTYSQDTSANLGGDLGFFGPGRMVKPFEDATMALPMGGTSDLVRTQFGYHIIRLTDRRDATTRSFSEVRDSIVRQMEFTAGQQALTEAVASFREAVGTDVGEFDRAASQLGLTVAETDLLGEDGSVAALGDSPRVMDAMFATGVSEVSSPVTLPQGTAFLRVTEALPPRAMTLDEARSELEADYRSSLALQAARRRVDGLLAAGDGLDTLARSSGKSVSTTTAFSRAQAVDPFNATAQDLAFTLTEGEVSQPVEVADGLLVFQVKERKEVDAEEFERLRAGLERSMLQQRRDRLFNAVVGQLERSGSIQVNQARLEGT